MSTRRELDDRIAAARLDARIVEYRQQQAQQRFWGIYDAGVADLARRKWRRLVTAGGASCSSCGKPIAPEAHWVVDPHGVGPEHARCCIDRLRDDQAA
jgi:hypothetical protein